MRFLLTGYNFDGFHGSMLHIAELATALISRGYEVNVASVNITKEIKTYVADSVGAKLYFIDDLPLDIEYDYVMAYHEPMLTYLTEKGLKYRHLGIGSLSSYEGKEFPGMLVKYGIPLFVHSEKLKKYWHEKLNIPNENIFVFPNSVPASFDNIKHDIKPLKSVAVVSNHVPEEVLDAVEILKKQNINVDIYGKGHKYTLITPEILNKHDAIITIGKTVQYSLYLGIPVYCYDRWGGVGYITLNTLKAEEFDNFGGRTGNKLSAQNIAEELTTGYDSVVKELSELQQYAKEHYSLEKSIDIILQNAALNSQVPNTPEWEIYKTHCYNSMLEIVRLKNIIESNKKVCYFVYNFLNKITFGKCFKNKAKLAVELNKYILK